jgi:hypothetical protein
MKRTKMKWMLAAMLLIAGVAVKSQAADTLPLDIRVQVTVSKALTIGTTSYDYGTLNVNVSSVSSSVLVTNTATGLVETYTIDGDNASGGNPWTLAASPGSDIYALAAQFSTAQPNDADGDWTNDDLTTSPIIATDSVLGNGTAAQSGAAVAPAATRNLWFRLKTPTAVSDTVKKLITLTVAVY